MPHVMISGPVSLEQWHQTFQPVTLRQDGFILKLKDAFINTDKSMLLIEAVVVDGNFSQTFYIVAARRGESVSVHLDALTDPEKNDGVRRLIAMIAHQLKSQDPACRYEQHSLAGFLRE